ncbi:MmgE/PrpD family protein, partial [Bordetella pertussis]|uniref:MmgE/PrpD family protein n=1 Tax=Bordetella pertussis TaxID=520 RepID=UPI0021CB50F2
MELDTIPAPALDKARACVFNGYGIALGSHPTPFFGVAERAVLAMDGEREDGATLLGSGRRSTVAGAALANAALFHGRALEAAYSPLTTAAGLRASPLYGTVAAAA